MLKKSSSRLLARLRDTRGISLMVTLGLTIMLILLASGVTKLVLGFMKTTKQVEQANVAFAAAEGGVELALYDLSNYGDGYEYSQSSDAGYNVCGDDSDFDITRKTNFSDTCRDGFEYRFVNFTDSSPSNSDLSGGIAFWRPWARTLESNTKYHIPNPYFADNRDGVADDNEWGELTKTNPIRLSLLIDDNPSEDDDPSSRYDWITPNVDARIIFNPGDDWNTSNGVNDQEKLLSWTFSALSNTGTEYTLQGVVWETDFVDVCDDGTQSTDCFEFNFSTSTVTIDTDGDVYAGQDINQNMTYHNQSSGFNRVSSQVEPSGFYYATPQEFLQELENAMSKDTDHQWVNAELVFDMLATLSETSRDNESNSLAFKLESDEQWADEYTRIIAEGFSGNVKQSIETSFRPSKALPIFSYVIFQ